MDTRCSYARTLFLLLACSATTRSLVIPSEYSSSGSGNSRTVNCTDEQMTELCALSEVGPVKNKPPVNNGVPTVVLRETFGQVVVGGGKTTPTLPLWRILCPEPHQEVIVVIMAMSITEGEYLQVKTTELSGCIDSTPWSARFKKRSILVGLVGSGNTTCSRFDLRYLCVESGSSAASREANKIFVESPQVLRYLKEHDTPTNSTFDGVMRTAFEKAVYLVTNRSFVSFTRDPVITAIIRMISSTTQAPPTSQVLPPSTQAPPPSTQAPPPTPQGPDPTKNTIPMTIGGDESNTSGNDQADTDNAADQ